MAATTVPAELQVVEKLVQIVDKLEVLRQESDATRNTLLAFIILFVLIAVITAVAKLVYIRWKRRANQ